MGAPHSAVPAGPGLGAALHAVSNPTRRAILDELARGEQPATAFVEHFAMSQPAISQHLRVLRQAGLVTEHRSGRQRIYRLVAAPIKEVFDWAAHYRRFWEDKMDALGSYLDAHADDEDPR